MSVTNPNLTIRDGTISCKSCNRPDAAEDMVACDKCNDWWHFGCAGVQASICERSWQCPNCSTYSATLGSELSTTSSAQLRLRQLAEAKALEDKIRREQADKEREFLAAKHQLEAEIEARKSVAGSLRSHKSRHSRHSRVGDWVAEQDFTTGNKIIENLQPETGQTSTPIVSGQVGTGDKATSYERPQLATQDPQQNTTTQQEHPGATASNEQVDLYLSNTPFGLPRQLLPPPKSSGLTEPAFLSRKASKTEGNHFLLSGPGQ
ncbi:uncharacterized protein LOC134222068 [Armigeres subalbatus]|uniref:uncharacterized protein LOC134222068 n=1 Tax=Armigeres subalbatus TaxID=124917 RepID=UPI002ED184FA